jgi:hypothetical protein
MRARCYNAAKMQTTEPFHMRAPQTYIFWLFDWDKQPVGFAGRFQPNYTFCRLDHEELYVQDAQVRFTVPLTHIVRWNTLRWASVGATVSTNVELTLASAVEVAPGISVGPQLYLMPMDVFQYKPSWADTQAFGAVLAHLRDGASLALEPNPYLRQWPGHKKSQPPSGGWDPMLPPTVYTQNPNTLSRFLLVLAVALIVVLLALIPLGLLFNLLFGQR